MPETRILDFTTQYPDILRIPELIAGKRAAIQHEPRYGGLIGAAEISRQATWLFADSGEVEGSEEHNDDAMHIPGSWNSRQVVRSKVVKEDIVTAPTSTIEDQVHSTDVQEPAPKDLTPPIAEAKHTARQPEATSPAQDATSEDTLQFPVLSFSESFYEKFSLETDNDTDDCSSQCTPSQSMLSIASTLDEHFRRRYAQSDDTALHTPSSSRCSIAESFFLVEPDEESENISQEQCFATPSRSSSPPVSEKAPLPGEFEDHSPQPNSSNSANASHDASADVKGNVPPLFTTVNISSSSLFHPLSLNSSFPAPAAAPAPAPAPHPVPATPNISLPPKSLTKSPYLLLAQPPPHLRPLSRSRFSHTHIHTRSHHPRPTHHIKLTHHRQNCNHHLKSLLLTLSTYLASTVHGIRSLTTQGLSGMKRRDGGMRSGSIEIGKVIIIGRDRRVDVGREDGGEDGKGGGLSGSWQEESMISGREIARRVEMVVRRGFGSGGVRDGGVARDW